MTESAVDRLQAEAVPDLPAGAPACTPFHRLARRQRAAMSAKVEAMTPQLAAYDEALKGVLDDQQLAEVIQPSQVYELLADIEDVLIAVAAEPTEMAAWVPSAKEHELLAVFVNWAATLGEAESSST